MSAQLNWGTSADVGLQIGAPKEAPEHSVVREALSRARRAPSVWNRQPWHWQHDGTQLHLLADPDRMTGVADPGGRLTLFSCGMALHHGVVAMLGLGWASEVTRFPVPGNVSHVASLQFTPASPGGDTPELAMFVAMGDRRSETRPLAGLGSLSPVPYQLATCAREYGATLTILDADAIAAIATAARLPIRSERISGWGVESDRSDVCVLMTDEDVPAAWVQAGSAMSAVVLLATALNVATGPIVDIDDRDLVAYSAQRCGGEGRYAQAVIRLGHRRYPALPRSHRRTVHDLLRPH